MGKKKDLKGPVTSLIRLKTPLRTQDHLAMLLQLTNFLLYTIFKYWASVWCSCHIPNFFLKNINI